MIGAMLIAVAGCAGNSADSTARRDGEATNAEVRQVVIATYNHPSLRDPASAGKPLDLEIAIKPRPEGMEMVAHTHHAHPMVPASAPGRN